VVLAVQRLDVVFSTGAGAVFISNISAIVPQAVSANVLPFSICSSSFVCAVELGDVELDGDLDILYTAFDYGVGWLENTLTVNPPPVSRPAATPLIFTKQRTVSEAMKIPTSVALGDVTGIASCCWCSPWPRGCFA
jgi:hypothetical protein